MKKLAIVTATRAEYGLLSRLIRMFKTSDKIDTQLIATGSHLSKEYGMTIQEIEKDGIIVDKRIDILSNNNSEYGVSETISNAIKYFSAYFEEFRPDAILVLGDRYEILAICIAAINYKIPIIHLYGGEATLGALDELIRNAITKLSILHFTSTEEYRNRVIQMGEEPSRVYNVGSLGVENIKEIQLLSRSELEYELKVKLDRYAVMTYHPTTTEKDILQKQIDEMLRVMVNNPQIVFICTKANADVGGAKINVALKDAANKYNNIILFDSLGIKKYLSAVKYCDFVIGNSSSGIIEVPTFHVPTINIGNRQKGRIQAKSVINCSYKYEDIQQAIKIACSQEFILLLENVVNPYEKDSTAKKIFDTINKYFNEGNISIVKKFYDLPYINM